MKKFYCLFLSLIFILLTTSISINAMEIDVDSNTSVNSNQASLANKLTALQLFSDVLMQGSSNFQIDNNDYNNIDEYLNDIVDLVIDNPVGLVLYANTEIDKLQQNFNQRSLEIFNSISLIPDASDWLEGYENIPTLSNWFDWLELKNHKSSLTYNEIFDVGKALFEIGRSQSGESTPEPNIPDGFESMINRLSTYEVSSSNISLQEWSAYYFDDCSIVNAVTQILDSSNRIYNLRFSTIGTISLITNLDDSITATYSGFQPSNLLHVYQYGSYSHKNKSSFQWHGSYWTSSTSSVDNSAFSFQTEFVGLSTALNYIYQNFRHINLIVDNVPWVSVSNTTTTPTTTTIGGTTIINEYNYPVSYSVPQGTEIDYDKLYQIIKKAFDDGDSTSLTTIYNGDVFIDSNNNTVYPSLDIDLPDIDTDLMNTFLKYCAIPVFSVELLQPLAEYKSPVSTTIFVATQAIPNDIKIVFGAFFVIFLFVFIIHRLLE